MGSPQFRQELADNLDYRKKLLQDSEFWYDQAIGFASLCSVDEMLNALLQMDFNVDEATRGSDIFSSDDIARYFKEVAQVFADHCQVNKK